MGKLFKVLICLSILGFAVYIGYLFGMPYYKFKVMQSDTMDIVRYELPRVVDIRRKIVKKAKDLNIPVKPENIQVKAGRFKYEAQLEWSETVNVFDKYQYTYNFEIDTTELSR